MYRICVGNFETMRSLQGLRLRNNNNNKYTNWNMRLWNGIMCLKIGISGGFHGPVDSIREGNCIV
jgi:hypothetical protein